MRTTSDNRAEESPARHPDEPVERDDEARAGEGDVADRPDRLGVHPGRGPRPAHVPHRDDAVELAERLVGQADETRREVRPDARLRLVEQRVDCAEVAVLRAAAHGCNVERAAGVDERERQVAVDVRVHARERELDRGDAAARARLEQRGPRARRPLGPEHVRSERAKVEVREDDVEPPREARVRERPRPHALVDRLRHGAVEGGERAHPVARRQCLLDRPQPLDDVVDTRRERCAQHVVQRHRCTTLRRVAATIENLIDDLERSYAEVQERMSDPSVYNDRNEAAAVGRRPKELETPSKPAQEWRLTREDVEASLADPELKELVAESQQRLAELEEELKLALVETDPADQKDVIVEIRQGVGGDEAAIWAGDVFRMLTRYAERRGFRWEQLSASPSESGGFKEIVFAVKGDGAYSIFKWEGGTHRVQRVPRTESQGRIHTSTATVAVMPEAEEVEVEIDQGDLKVDVYRSTGPGGQSVNTTDSAVRITHVPTGLVVAMQDEKSQLQNKQKAMRVLRARLYELERGRQQQELDTARRLQIGSGERAEKIRTYNFPENRLTDHRVKFTAHRLDAILEGELDQFTEALAAEERRHALETATA